jgi:hypothetical protein
MTVVLDKCALELFPPTLARQGCPQALVGWQGVQGQLSMWGCWLVSHFPLPEGFPALAHQSEAPRYGAFYRTKL